MNTRTFTSRTTCMPGVNGQQNSCGSRPAFKTVSFVQHAPKLWDISSQSINHQDSGEPVPVSCIDPRRLVVLLVSLACLHASKRLGGQLNDIQ